MSRLLRRELRSPAVPGAAGVAAAAAAGGLPLFATAKALAAATPSSPPRPPSRDSTTRSPTSRKRTSASTGTTRSKDNGLLRTHVSNNWQITKPHIRSDFYTKKQQDVIHDIFKGIINPDGTTASSSSSRTTPAARNGASEQSIAIFGKPGGDKFEFVMTGRHMTLRADGHSQDHVAFGGPIFYGHAASGFNEKVHHPGNVFWPQAVAGQQGLPDARRQAAGQGAWSQKRPQEAAVGFQGDKGTFPGIPVDGADRRAEKGAAKDPVDADRAVPQGGPGRGAGLPEEAGRPRQVQPGLLQGRRHRRRRRVGQLAAGRAVVRLVLPRRSRTSTSGSTWPTTRRSRRTPRGDSGV